MKITTVVSTIAAFVLIGTAGEARAQAATPEVTATLLGGNVYGVDGQGGRISALVGADGIFMVDAQSAAITERIVAALRPHSQSPIKLLVNTHVHADHTGGNENFGKMGVTIMARPNLRARLLKPNPGANGQQPPPAPPAALPSVVFDAPMTLYMNGETVEIIPLPACHTDGDTAIRFVTANVLATGDVFRSTGYPNIDRANGGTLNGMLDCMAKFLELAGPSTKVVPGHGPVTDRAAVMAHRDVIVTVRDRVATLIQEGKTVEQAVAAKPTADMDERVGANADRFVQQVFEELKAAPGM